MTAIEEEKLYIKTEEAEVQSFGSNQEVPAPFVAIEPIPEESNRYELTSKKLKAYETSLKKLNISKNYKSSVLQSN